ncbi:zinc finger protein 518A isoform X2 [Xenopus laevis]|uniref:Zinc finger protein 518A isoform X2 n=1 Tax=Xenopus laevis TaxID=8355 RepID=A0A8J1LBE3_XENLA|nr:zinc finger protein 518A isoform X2 [Xenopus laevis]
MKSPNKDLSVETEESGPAKEDLWNFAEHDSDTNEPSSLSSFSVNESILHDVDEDPDTAGNEKGEKAQNSTSKKQTARKSFWRGTLSNLDSSADLNAVIKSEPQLDDDIANISAKVLHFFCQKCSNGIRYSPNDLQKHFLIMHNGESPLYPCEMCDFSANDFQTFKQHRKTHRSALVKYASDKGSWRKEANRGQMENDEDDGQGTSGLQYNSIDKSQAMSAISTYNMDQTIQDGISSVTTIKCNNEEVNSNVLKNAVHGPTVLMVKNNKINVPANYSATFMGYKMVNGKQNIVIKLLPSNKQSGAALQSPPPKLGSLTPQAHGLRPFEVSSNGVDRRPAPSFKPNMSLGPTSVASLQKISVPFRPRTESHPIRHGTPNLIRQGTAASQAFLQSLRKDLVCRSTIPNSSIGTDRASNIKEEPEEYSINEQQNMQKERNHGYEFAAGPMRQGRMPNPSNLNPSMQHLPRHRHSSDSGLALSKTLYTKDSEIRNSVLHSLTASRPGGLNSTNTNIKPQNNYLGGNLHMRDKPATLLVKNSKSDNILFMPRITSVFSLQNRAPASSSIVKNTYLHNMLQENKTLYDRLAASKNNPAGNSTPTSTRLPNVASRFDPRLTSGDNISKGSASSFMQGQLSSALDIKTPHPSKVGDLLKAHSDAIVNQQLAKEKMLGIARPAGSSPAFRVVKTPQNAGYPHSNTLLLPSNSNALLLPILPTHQSGLKMTASQPVTQSNTGINTNTPVNAKSNMVLTLTNGPFGTIRNVSNGNPQTMASPVATAGNYQGKFPLQRLQRPAAPYLMNAELKDRTVNNLPAKILSGSTPANKLPVNLNLLQYHMNSNSSVGKAGNLESVRNQKSVQKQPVYALLPDGKQAVLLNYVLPKSAPTKSPKTFARFLPWNIQPKNTEEAKETSFVSSNSSDNSLVKVKIEDTSAENPSFPENTYAVSSTSHQGITEHSQWSLRPRPNFASVKDHLYSTSSHQTLLQPCAANKLNCKPSIANTWNTRNKSLKRKASDSSSCTGDFDFKNKIAKKKTVDEFVELPRKKMLHRKCKEKVYYTSDVVIDIPTPSPPKDIVQTLRLYPFNASQVVTCPQQNQPVVVLNHPDADIPGVVNIMRTISKFSSHVLTVTLSKRTLEALLESKLNSAAGAISDGLTGRRSRRAKPISPVNERFVLKLTLKKTSKNNYKIVKNTSENQDKAKFHCWFCGRIFDNQDEWVGHGQRHLMEATKDWNTLF